MPYLAVLAGILTIAAGDVPDTAKIGDLKLCRASVNSATIGIDQDTGETVANISLNEAARTTFANLTKRYVGRKLPVTLNGKVIAEPWIITYILEGQFTINGPEKPALERIVKAALADC